MADKLTSLDSYRLLGRSGLRVSPLCLGTMTFGTAWNVDMKIGADKEESRRVFDIYCDRGGNFIDTANFYAGGESESFLGEFVGDRREQLVLATKFSLNMRPGDPNSGGNHRKNIVQSLEASLKRLKTDYVDLYWLHIWEFRTPVDEVMRALDDMVRAGKVLYIGFSDTPAWKVSQAQAIADLRGWTPVVALQISYSLAQRTVERDLMPMARELNIGVTPWSPLAGGLLTGKHFPQSGGQSGADGDTTEGRKARIEGRMTEKNVAIVETVKQIASETGRTPAQVALNWLMQKPGVTSPIIGARKASQLEDNLACLDFTLSAEQMQRLDEVSAIDLGFPHEMVVDFDSGRTYLTGGAKIERGARTWYF